MATPVYPTPLTGKIWKVTLFLNSGVAGWSESHYVQLPTSGSGSDQTKISALITALVRTRKWGLNGISSIVDARYKDVETKGRGQLLGGVLFPANGTTDPGGSTEVPQVSIESRAYDATSGVRSVQALHGLNSTWVQFVAGKPEPNPMAPSLATFTLAWQRLLIEGKDNNNTVVGTFAMRYRVKDPTVNPQMQLYDIRINTDGTLNFYYQGAGVIPVGTAFVVVGPRIKCWPKIAGTYTSAGGEVDPNPPPGVTGIGWIVHTYKKPCCAKPSDLGLKPTWYLQRATYAYAAISYVELPRIVNKKVGRPFGGSAGRAKGRCC